MRPLRSSLAASASRGSVVVLCASSCPTARFALNSLHSLTVITRTVAWPDPLSTRHKTQHHNGVTSYLILLLPESTA